MRRLTLLAIVLSGLTFASISGYFLLIEWAVLDSSYRRYRQVVSTPAPKLEDLFVAEAAQNIHRINCFAEGVGVLLGGVITAIGLHGLATLPKQSN